MSFLLDTPSPLDMVRDIRKFFDTQWEDSLCDATVYGYGYSTTSVTNVGYNCDSRIRVGTMDQDGDSWVNLNGGGQLSDKPGNGEQIRGMVSGLGSVIGYPRSTPWQRRCGVYGHKSMQVL